MSLTRGSACKEFNTYMESCQCSWMVNVQHRGGSELGLGPASPLSDSMTLSKSLKLFKPQLTHCYAKSRQSCPTLCDPMDGNPPGSPVPGILQARTLEWVAISFSNAWKWKVKVKSLSRVGLFTTPWTAAYQAPPPIGFSRQEYWSGVPLPSPVDSLVKGKQWQNLPP